MRIFLLLLLSMSLCVQGYNAPKKDYKVATKHPKIFNYTEDIHANTDTEFFDDNLNALNLEAYEGKAVLVVFWATWCFSCASKMSSLNNLKKDFRRLPFEVLAISEDSKGLDVVKEFYKKHEITHIPMLLDVRNALMKSMGINILPTALLLDENGKIIYEFTGAINWQDDEVREIILSVIPGKPFMPNNTYNHALNF